MITWQYIDKWTDEHNTITVLIFLLIAYLICLFIPSIFVLAGLIYINFEYNYSAISVIIKIGTLIYVIFIIRIFCIAGNNFN